MNTSRYFSYTAVLVLPFLAGCFGGGVERPETVPVSGTVVFNGQPIEGATVSFWGEGAPRAATGITDKEGKFQLSMFAFNDGAFEGVNVITVSKPDPAASSAPAMTSTPDDPSQMTQMYVKTMEEMNKNKGKKGGIPGKYGTRETTPLKETVKKGEENVFVVQLVD